MSGATAASYIAMGSSVMGMASGAMGSYYGARSQKSALQFQATMADTNARIAELSAQSALAGGHQQIAAQTMRAGQVKGAQRAAMAANGIDLGEGSAGEVQASTDILKEIDKNTLEANAIRSAWGYRTEAVNANNQALMSRASASGISPGGAAFTSLLGSAGSVAQSWYGFKKSAVDTRPTLDEFGAANNWWGSAK